MSEPCGAPSAARGQGFPCPRCGAAGEPVDWLTVAALTRVRLPPRGRYRVCAEAGCPVVYHAEDGTDIRDSALRVRPAFKEPVGPTSLVCYCFLHTRGDLEEELRERGRTSIPDAIRAEVKAGNCACEARNPRGRCCLGEVERTRRELEEQLQSGGGQRE